MKYFRWLRFIWFLRLKMCSKIKTEKLEIFVTSEMDKVQQLSSVKKRFIICMSKCYILKLKSAGGSK